MKKIQTLILITLMSLFAFNAMASETTSKHYQYQYPPDSVINSPETSYLNEFLNPENFKKVNLQCGFKPFPPMGCVVGSCVCDQNGRNCQWTFICN